MSWEEYPRQMNASGLNFSGIFSHDGNPWAKSEQLKATPQEVAAIVAGIKSASFPDGLHIGGVRYTVIRILPDTVTAKCRGAAKDNENYLVHGALAKTCFVLGGMCGPSERDTTKIVEDMRDHLVKCNY